MLTPKTIASLINDAVDMWYSYPEDRCFEEYAYEGFLNGLTYQNELTSSVRAKLIELVYHDEPEYKKSTFEDKKRWILDMVQLFSKATTYTEVDIVEFLSVAMEKECSSCLENKAQFDVSRYPEECQVGGHDFCFTKPIVMFVREYQEKKGRPMGLPIINSCRMEES